jgi:hypothetical protein
MREGGKKFFFVILGIVCSFLFWIILIQTIIIVTDHPLRYSF